MTRMDLDLEIVVDLKLGITVSALAKKPLERYKKFKPMEANGASRVECYSW